MKSSNKKVIIIDCQIGNLFSVKQACETVGLNATISHSREEILSADALILPGVGAFNEAIKNLNRSDLVDAIHKKVEKGIPLFGICLGQQLLFTESEEFGAGKGLNLLSGTIKKFSSEDANKKIKVPNIGWNKITGLPRRWSESALKDLANDDFMYFVHSFYVQPSDTSCILTTTNYEEIAFCSSVHRENIFATQFHPEKSGEKGISIYKNWGLINNLL